MIFIEQISVCRILSDQPSSHFDWFFHHVERNGLSPTKDYYSQGTVLFRATPPMSVMTGQATLFVPQSHDLPCAFPRRARRGGREDDDGFDSYVYFNWLKD